MDQPLPPWPTGLTMSRSGRTIKTPIRYLEDSNQEIKQSAVKAAAVKATVQPVNPKPAARPPGRSPQIKPKRSQPAAQPAEQTSPLQPVPAIPEDARPVQARQCEDCPVDLGGHLPLTQEAMVCTFNKAQKFESGQCGYTTHCKYHFVEHVYQLHIRGHHTLTDAASEEFDKKYFTLCHDCGKFDEKLELHLARRRYTRDHTVMRAKRIQSRLTEEEKKKENRNEASARIEREDYDPSSDDEDESHIAKPDDPILDDNEYLVDQFTDCFYDFDYPLQGVTFTMDCGYFDAEDANGDQCLRNLHCYRKLQKFCAQKQLNSGRDCVLSGKVPPLRSAHVAARKQELVLGRQDCFHEIYDWDYISGEFLVIFKFLTYEPRAGEDSSYLYQYVGFWITFDKLVGLNQGCAQGVANFIEGQLPIVRRQMQEATGEKVVDLGVLSAVDANAALVYMSTGSSTPESSVSQGPGYNSMLDDSAPSTSHKSLEHSKKKKKKETIQDVFDSSHEHEQIDNLNRAKLELEASKTMDATAAKAATPTSTRSVRNESLSHDPGYPSMRVGSPSSSSNNLLEQQKKTDQVDSDSTEKSMDNLNGEHAVELEAPKMIEADSSVASMFTGLIAPESPLSQDPGYLSMPGGSAASLSRKSIKHHKKTDENDTDSSNKDGEEPMNTEEQSNLAAYRVGLNCPSILRLLSTGISGEMPINSQSQDNKLDNHEPESKGTLQQGTSINKDINKKCTGSNDQMASGSCSIINNNSVSLCGSSKRSADDTNERLQSKKLKTCTSSTSGLSSFAVAITEQAAPGNEDHFQDSQTQETPKNKPGSNVNLENELKNVNNKTNLLNVRANDATDDNESCSENLVIDEDKACGYDRDDLIENIKETEKASIPTTNDAITINNESSKADDPVSSPNDKEEEESNIEAKSKLPDSPKMASLINECNENSSDGISNKDEKRSDEASISLTAITLKNNETSVQSDEIPSGSTEELNEKNKNSARLNGSSKRSADDSNDGALQRKMQKTSALSTADSLSSASIEPFVINERVAGEEESQIQYNQTDEGIEALEEVPEPNVYLQNDPNINNNQINLLNERVNAANLRDGDDDDDYSSDRELIIDESVTDEDRDDPTGKNIEDNAQENMPVTVTHMMKNGSPKPVELPSTFRATEEKENNDKESTDAIEMEQPDSPNQSTAEMVNENKEDKTDDISSGMEGITIQESKPLAVITATNNKSLEPMDQLAFTSGANENQSSIDESEKRVKEMEQSESTDQSLVLLMNDNNVNNDDDNPPSDEEVQGPDWQSHSLTLLIKQNYNECSSVIYGLIHQIENKNLQHSEMKQIGESVGTLENSCPKAIPINGEQIEEIVNRNLEDGNEFIPINSEINVSQYTQEPKHNQPMVPLCAVTQSILLKNNEIASSSSAMDFDMQSLKDTEKPHVEIVEFMDELLDFAVDQIHDQFGTMLAINVQPSSSSSASSSPSQSLKVDFSGDSSANGDIKDEEQNFFNGYMRNEPKHDENMHEDVDLESLHTIETMQINQFEANCLAPKVNVLINEGSDDTSQDVEISQLALAPVGYHHENDNRDGQNDELMLPTHGFNLFPPTILDENYDPNDYELSIN